MLRKSSYNFHTIGYNLCYETYTLCYNPCYNYHNFQGTPKYGSKQKLILAGLEPAIFGSEDQRLFH